MPRCRRSAWGIIAFAIAIASSLSAQEFRGSLGGRVIDPQQAVVPGVKIVATNQDNGAKFQTVSGADGDYSLTFLPPGNYSLIAETQGFKKYINNNVRVQTNEHEQLDITLTVGGVDQAVTVTAEASMIETSTASTGQVIGTHQIENMPMNGRTPLVLAQLAYAVTPNSDPTFAR